jgi:hypothetical protein
MSWARQILDRELGYATYPLPEMINQGRASSRRIAQSLKYIARAADYVFG